MTEPNPPGGGGDDPPAPTPASSRRGRGTARTTSAARAAAEQPEGAMAALAPNVAAAEAPAAPNAAAPNLSTLVAGLAGPLAFLQNASSGDKPLTAIHANQLLRRVKDLAPRLPATHALSELIADFPSLSTDGECLLPPTPPDDVRALISVLLEAVEEDKRAQAAATAVGASPQNPRKRSRAQGGAGTSRERGTIAERQPMTVHDYSAQLRTAVTELETDGFLQDVNMRGEGMPESDEQQPTDEALRAVLARSSTRGRLGDGGAGREGQAELPSLRRSHQHSGVGGGRAAGRDGDLRAAAAAPGSLLLAGGSELAAGDAPERVGHRLGGAGGGEGEGQAARVAAAAHSAARLAAAAAQRATFSAL